MSRWGNCYDNAHTESFWSRLKIELLDGGTFPGQAEASLEISHYIASYNAKRRHSANGYQSPNHFETLLQTTSQCCPPYLDYLTPGVTEEGKVSPCRLTTHRPALSTQVNDILCRSN